jgi:hypothetical protein
MEHYQTMSQFNYTLPSGAEFVVRGPAGATQAQADSIFYEQVAAGSLVGYESGQTLTSSATQLTKFELSRLDRGTAGVDSNPVLAISQGLLTVANTSSAQSILAIIQGLPVPIGTPNLSNVPLTNPVDEADVVLIKGEDLGPGSVGPLSSYQIQKLLAQIAALVNQESDQISRNKGIGRYGFTAYQLEQAGYVKPGTSLKFFAADPEDFVSVMSSPSVWTGKDGAYSLNDVLSDANFQNRAQTQLMQQGYDELVANGTISTVSKPSISVATGQVYTNSGLQSVGALTAASLLGVNLGSLSGIAQNALTGSTALNRLLGGTNVNLNTIGSGAVNSLTAGVGNLGNLANLNFASIGSTLTNQITGSVGGLVANASKFGSQATALWARTGSLDFNNISGGLTNLAGTNLTNLAGGLTSNLNNLAGGLTGNLRNITSNLTNLVPGSLGNLTSNLDIFGKAGSFATNFANPLGNLNDLGKLANLGNLGAIQGQLTGQLGQLSGALTGQLGALSGQLTGALGSLGNFANIGAVGDLFGGGGDLVSGTAAAGGFNNTINRATVDAAFARIVGSSKIPLPTFQYPSLASLAPRLDIQQAQKFLENQLRSASGSFGQTVTI